MAAPAQEPDEGLRRMRKVCDLSSWVEPSLAVSMLRRREKSVEASLSRLKPMKSVAGKLATCNKDVHESRMGC